MSAVGAERGANAEPSPDRERSAIGMERAIARVLTVGTYVGVALLALGVVLLLAAGRSPLEGGPRIDPGRLADDVAALRPEGFLWLGLLAVIATPAARVSASLVGYVARRERRMAGVAAGILVVIAVSVVLGLAAEG